MLKAPAPFPYVGSIAYMDDRNADDHDVVEKVRIQRDNGDGTALISIDSRRYPHEVASGNRTVEFEKLRAVEQAAPTAPAATRKRRRVAGK